MAISLSLDAKSNITLSNEGKSTSKTVDSALETVDEATYMVDLPTLILSKESKSNISLSNESK